LLRAGEREGLVELSFRSAGKPYTVGRRLVRGKAGGASQKDAYLVGGGAREELSVEQLRAAVIKVLGFREAPATKSKSQVFRYGIFTPQEEMKAILDQGAEDRRQTLRRAFGIEEFKRARENADLVKSALREQAGAMELRLADAPRLEEEAVQAQALRDTIASQLAESEREREASSDAYRACESTLRAGELLDARDRELERSLGEAASSRAKLRERQAAAERAVAEIQQTEEEARPLRPVAAGLAELEDQLKSAELQAEEKRKLDEDLKLRDARVKGLTERREELSQESEILRKVLDGAEGVLKGQRELEGARKQLEKVVQDLAAAREAEKRLEQLRERLEALGREGSRAKELERQVEHLGKQAQEAGPASKALQELEGAMAQSQAAQGAAHASLERLEGESEELQGLAGKARCPKCKQPLDREHLAEHRKEIGEAITQARKQLAHSQARTRTLDKERAGLAKARDAAERAAREREGLAAELRRSQQALLEATSVHGELEAAKQGLAKAEGLSEERKRLEREIREKSSFDRRAGELESARRRWNDISALLAKARREIDEATKAARDVRERLAAWPSDGRELPRLRAEVQKARDAATRLKAMERKLSSRPEVEQSRAAAGRELGEVDRREAALSTERVALRAQLQQRPLSDLRTAFERASARRAAVEERLKASAEGLERQGEALARAKARLAELGSQRKHLDAVRHARDFLEQFFQAAMEEVEVRVLADLNAQFNARFQEYFERLMEGAPLDVQIDGEFSPQVLQGPHPLPVDALSGGERTSVALAYRLALNTLVSRAAGMETPDLLILDEPTDGFSKEQLSRVGDLLRTLDCQQVILVSHERELESCADQVFEVLKDGDVSRVEAR
jgi:exonuclease SbcC